MSGLNREVLLRPEDSLRRAIEVLEATGSGITLVTDEYGRLLGTVTDGDIRRAVLRGISMECPLREVMNPHPVSASRSTSRHAILELMRTRGISHIPLLESDGRVVELVSIRDLIGAQPVDNYVVVMAGGLGSRLYPLTAHTPKPMLKIAERPILELIIERFKNHGFHRFLVAVHYRAEQIEEYFGDGSRLDVQIEFLREPTRLGTAGAIRLAERLLTDSFCVVNGDVLTNVDITSFWQFHRSHDNAMTIGAKQLEINVEYGVLDLKESLVLGLEEKPILRFFVNAGLYVLEPTLVHLVPKDQPFDMTDLIAAALKSGVKVGGFPILETWLDIGRVDDYRGAQQAFRLQKSHPWGKEKS